MSEKVEVHDVIVELSESTSEGQLLDPRIRVGDYVEQHQVLVEVDSDKVTIELVAPVAGRVMEIAPAGPIARGAVAVRIEAIADPLKVATLREATKVRREDLAAREKRAREAAAQRGTTSVLTAARSLRFGQVTRDVDVRMLDARVASLAARALPHAEARAHLVRVARALAVAPTLGLPTPLTLAYVSVRAGIEVRSLHRVSVDDDEAQVTEVEEAPASSIDLVVVRFHDTVEHVGLPLVWSRGNRAVVLAAPRPVAVPDASGAPALSPRAEISLQLGEPGGLCQRVLGALAEQLERD